MRPPRLPRGPLRGVALKILSVCVFTVMASLIKATSDHVPPGEAVFFRSLFALPVIVGWLLWTGQMREGLRTAIPMAHVWRALVGTTAMGLGFAALGLLPLPEVTAIGYAGPLLVVVFAAAFLGEEVRAFRVGAVGLGLVGVLVVLAPRLSLGPEGLGAREALGAMVALMGAVFAALAQVTVRRLTQSESTTAIVFYFSLFATLLALVTLPFGWVVPRGPEALMLGLAGLLGGVGQVLLTASYRLADASLIAPFEYASMLLAILVGLLVFDEVPTAPMLLGAALVIAAGVLIIWRERRLGLERREERRAGKGL